MSFHVIVHYKAFPRLDSLIHVSRSGAFRCFHLIYTASKRAECYVSSILKPELFVDSLFRTLKISFNHETLKLPLSANMNLFQLDF